MKQSHTYSHEESFITYEKEPVRTYVFVPRITREDNSAISKNDYSLSRLEEAKGLAHAIHLYIVHAQYQTINHPNPATLFGKGKVEEIAQSIKAEDIALVVIDHPLTPVQQRNLEKAWNCKVIDRTALILEIFGERARTKEGVLQVELAHLNYQKGRLVRSWTHLERQRGGGGFLGGPGETQIETDRRILQEKINGIKRELAKTVKTRKLHRAKRKKVPYPVIALVGYTNAGKSTLFNQITGAEVVAKDMLFATLDPTLRRIQLNRQDTNGDAISLQKDHDKKGQTLILSDTVGFISHLPTHLVAAFRATLEEVTEADVILHVRDMSDPDNVHHKQDVLEILNSLDIDTNNSDRIIEVWNKIDLLNPEQQDYLEHQAKTTSLPSLPVSAYSGEGVNQLIELIAQKSLGHLKTQSVHLKPTELSLLDWLYRNGVEKQQQFEEDGSVNLKISLSPTDWEIFKAERKKIHDV